MTHEGHVYRAHYTNEFTQVRSCFISSEANQQIIDYLPGLATAVMLRHLSYRTALLDSVVDNLLSY